MAPPWTAAQCRLGFGFTGVDLPAGGLCVQDMLFTGDEVDTLDRAVLWWEEVRASITSQISLEAIFLKVGPSDVGPTYVRSVNQAGAGGTGLNAPQAAVLVNKVVPGVSGRLGGRMYVPGVVSNQTNDGGVLTPTALMQWEGNFAAAYVALTDDGNYPLYVLSSLSSDPRIQTGYAVQGRLATQRRRLRR